MIRIRPTIQCDLEQLERAYNEAFESNSRFFPDNMVEDEEDESPDLSPFLAYSMPDKISLSFEVDRVIVGGAILTRHNSSANKLERFYISPEYQNKGFGYKAWKYIEETYPNPFGWELVTPTCLINNAYFYINKCGFVISQVRDIADDGVGMFVFKKYAFSQGN